MTNKGKLNVWDIFCMAAGTMISSGLFILPAIAYRHSGPSIVVAYFLAGVLMLPSVFSKAELLTAMPKAGGTYFFIERSFGPSLGVFGGLASWFSIALKSSFALVGVGLFLKYFFPSLDYFQVKLVAILFCVLFVIVNIFSVKLSARIQNIMVIFILLVCITYVLLGVNNITWGNFTPFFSKGKGGIFSVIGLVFISYGGLTKVASISEDTKNPSKTIPAGMFLAFFVVQILYCACVAVTIGILSPLQLTTSFMPLTQGALKVGGMSFAIVLSVAAVASFFSTANAGIFSSSRVPFAMAKDGLISSKFSKCSKKFNTPYISILFTGLFMLMMILFLDLTNLVKIASTLMIILFMFTNLSVIVMRESKIINYRPTFKSPFYPWLQIFALFSYGFLIFKMGKISLLVSTGFVIVSLVWFLFFSRKTQRQSALMHLVERITAKEFVDTSLEDELKDILHERDNIVKDKFDRLIENCPVLDIEEGMSRDAFFKYTSGILSKRTGVAASEINALLIKREKESHTVIEKGLAIPHIVIPGEGKFEIILARSRSGIPFSLDEDPVHIAFVLAGTQDVRNFHLRVLMAIAQIVSENNFYKHWMSMKDKVALRMLILSSTRKREL